MGGRMDLGCPDNQLGLSPSLSNASYLKNGWFTSWLLENHYRTAVGQLASLLVIPKTNYQSRNVPPSGFI